MASTDTETALPHTDKLDTVMSDHDETIPAAADTQDAVANAPESDPSETAQIIKATSEVQSFQSETSTLAYEQTPFVEFKLQVLELCHLLWPSKTKEPLLEQPRRGSGYRFSGLLKSRKLGRIKPSTPVVPRETSKQHGKEFIIDRMTGGSYNRITGITIVDPKSDQPEQLILRVPRITWRSRPDREVATLRYIRQHCSVPVPDVKAFSFNAANPLKDPYIVQSRIAGTDLRKAMDDDLSQEQWRAIAKQVGQIMLQFRGMKSPVPGLIEEVTNEKGAQAFVVKPFDIKHPFDKDWTQKQKTPLHEAGNVTALNFYEKGTLDFFLAQFGRWRAEELRIVPTDILHMDFMERLATIASQMSRLGYFEDSQNCFSHLDLAAHNIMVEVRPDKSVSVTGVLDFDSACFAPAFVSCYPPWWLWQDETQPGDAMEDESQSNETPPDPELEEIKRIFEGTVGDDFLRYAYGPQYRLARRLFKIACHGDVSNETSKKILEFFDDWNAFYKSEIESSDSQDGEDSSSSAAADFHDTQEQKGFEADNDL